MSKYTESKWIPHNDVSLLTARCDESVLVAVNEAVDSFLMQVKGFVFVR